MPQCQAKSKRTGEQCRGSAMRDKRVCYYHGGKAGRPIVHGRYSKSLEKHPDIKLLYEDAKSDPNLMETLNEIALLRAKLQHWLESFAGMKDAKTMAGVTQYTEAITKLVERRHKMLYGEQITITMRHFEALVAQMLEMVKQVYGDDDRYFAFLERASSLYSADPNRAGKTT